MKKNLMLILFTPAIFVLILFSSFSGNTSRYPGGSPGGYTGSPGDGHDCTACHNGTSSPVIGWITSNVPAEGYWPGETYVITVTVSGNGDKGFEVSPQELDGTLQGTLIAGSGTKLVAGSSAVTQTSSSSADPKIWTFDWVAPTTAGTGEVNFYGAFAINKQVTKTSTMTLQENLGVYIPEQAFSGLRTYPNPANEYLTIDFYMTAATQGTITISDLSGSAMTWEYQRDFSIGQNTIDVPVAELAPGIYIYRLQAGEQTATGKMVVLR